MTTPNIGSLRTSENGSHSYHNGMTFLQALARLSRLGEVEQDGYRITVIRWDGGTINAEFRPLHRVHETPRVDGDDIVVPCPCYRLNGDLWHEDDTPDGMSVAYHLSVTDATFIRGIPTHASVAIETYRATLKALLLAGF